MMMSIEDGSWSLPPCIPSSVVGGRDGLQDVLHDKGEGREAADHEEVGDGALPKGVNPTLVAGRINFASPHNTRIIFTKRHCKNSTSLATKKIMIFI